MYNILLTILSISGVLADGHLGGGGEYQEPKLLKAAVHVPSPHYNHLATSCTTTNAWESWTCEGSVKRNTICFSLCSFQLWNASTVSAGVHPPQFWQEQGPLFENYAEDGPHMFNNKDRGCIIKAKAIGNYDVTEGSCETTTQWLQQKTVGTVSGTPLSTAPTEPYFSLYLDMNKPYGKLTYCVACHNANGVQIWANPFTFTPQATTYSDSSWADLGSTYYNQLIPTHVFVINTGTNNRYSKTLPLVGTYYSDAAKDFTEPIPKCEYQINTPIATLVGTTTAIGMLSSITITMDTTVVIQPAQTAYLNCYRWKQTAWNAIVQIPFQIEVQAIPDCSTGWFVWSSQTIQQPGDNYPTITLNEDEEDKQPVQLTMMYAAWDISICMPRTPVLFYYEDNVTEPINPIDMTRSDIPTFNNDTTGVIITYPTVTANARFNHSIYWKFFVETPAGNMPIRSRSWHVTYCHAQLQPVYTPLVDPFRIKLDDNSEFIDSGKWTPPFDALTLGTEDRQCRVRSIQFYKTDGTAITQISFQIAVNTIFGYLYPPYHNTAQTLTLRLKVTFKGGAILWMTQGDYTKQDITVTFFCGTGSAFIGPVQDDAHQRVEAGLATTMFLVRPTSYKTSMINCPIVVKEVLDVGLQQMDAQNYILPVNNSQEKLYQFKIKLTDDGGNTYFTDMLKFEVGCSLVGWSWAHDGSVISPVNYTGKGFWKLLPNSLDSSNITVSDYPFCYPREHTIEVVTVNETFVTPIAFQSADCLGSQPCQKIEFDALNLPTSSFVDNQVVQVDLKINTRISIGTIRASPIFKYYVCHNKSATPLRYGYPTGFGSNQAVPDIGTAVGQTYFLTYMTGSTNPHCPVDIVFVSLDSVNFNLSIPGVFDEPFADPVLTNSFRIMPADKHIHKVYHFYVKMITKGGNSIVDMAPYSLTVGCVKGFTDVMQHPQFIQNAMYKPKEFTSYEIFYPLPGKFWWCTPVKVEPIEVLTVDLSTGMQIESNKTVFCAHEGHPCHTFSLGDEALIPNRSTTFKIQMIIGKDMIYETPRVNLTITSCERGTTELFYPKRENRTAFFQMNTAQNTLTVPNFGCTYEPCCQGMVTGITRDKVETIDIERDGFTNYTNVAIDKVNFVSKQIILQIPVQVRSQLAFRIWQRTKFGDWAYSPFINVEVAYRVHSDPYYEQQLRLRIDGLPNLFNGTITNSTFNASNLLNVTQAEEVVHEAIKVDNFTVNEVEATKVIEDMSKLKNFSFDYLYYFNSRNQMEAKRRKYIPSTLNQTLFMERSEFAAKIKAVQNDGTINIVFSQPLKDETQGVLPESIDERILSVQTLPSEETLERLKAKSQNPADVLRVKQWKCTHFFRDKLDLEVQFENPLAVSVGDQKDWILIQIIDTAAFKDEKDSIRIAQSSTRLVFPLPKQMHNDPIDKTFKEMKSPIQTTANILAIAQVTINIVVSLGMGTFIAMIETLNIVVFSSMFHQQPPPNKQLYSKALVEFLGAEVLDPSWTTEVMFDFEAQENFVDEMITDGKLQEDTALTRNIYDLGFEQFDPILNVGGLYIMFAVTMALMSLSVLLKVWWNSVKSLKSIVKSVFREGGEIIGREHEAKNEDIPETQEHQIAVDTEDDHTEDIEAGKATKKDLITSRKKKKLRVRFEDPSQLQSVLNQEEEFKSEANDKVSVSKEHQDFSLKAKLLETKQKLKEILVKSKQHMSKQARSIQKDLFFSAPVVLIAEQVFQVTLTVFLFIYQPTELTNSVKEKSFMTYVCGIIFVVFISLICFLVLPVVYFAIPLVKIEILEQSRFQKYFGEVYSDINISSKQARFFLLFNYLRRLTMVLFALTVPLSVGNQILVLFYLNLISLIFVGFQAPFVDSFKNKLALFNEACVCFLALSMVLETDFCDNLQTRYYAGYMFLAFLILNIATNMFIMFKKQLNFVRLCVIFLYNRFQWASFVIMETICPAQLRQMTFDYYRQTKSKVQQKCRSISDKLRVLPVEIEQRYLDYRQAKLDAAIRKMLTEEEEREIQRLKEAQEMTIRRQKEIRRQIQETQSLIHEKLKINILELYQAHKPSPAEDAFIKQIKSYEKALETRKLEAFDNKRLFPTQIFRSQIMNNILTKRPIQMSLKILKEWQSEMTRSERMRLTYEFLTVLEFYKQWYDLEWSASANSEKQIASFNKFFKKYSQEIKDTFKNVTMNEHQKESLYDWDNMCKYVYGQTPLEDKRKQWYFVNFNPWWLQVPENLEQLREDFMTTDLALKEEEVPGLYSKLDELLQQLDFGIRPIREKNMKKKKIQVPRHWTAQEVAQSFDPKARTNMLRKLFVQAEQNGPEAISQFETRVPQLFQLHKMKADKIIDYYELKKNHFCLKTKNLEEHIWDMVTYMRTSDFKEE